MFRGVKVLGGVLVLGVVATPDVPAGPAQPQMHPPISHGQAFFATLTAWPVRLYKIQMLAFS